jgi:DNA repair protein RecN (Recombination protein N)
VLKKFTIEQLVIIDKLVLDVADKLTVLTGETGAGKSILLDALGLILGNKSDKDLIRTGAEKSVIEAQFDLPANAIVWKYLIEQGFVNASQPELVIHREVKREGDDEMLVNGKPATLEILTKAGTMLCEIHGQFANQSLFEPSNQLNLLDLSGSFNEETYKNVREEFLNLSRYKQELEDESEFYKKNVQNIGKMETLVSRFDDAGLKEMDIKAMKEEYTRLLTAYETSEAFQEILSHLVATNGAIKSLSASNIALERQQNLDMEKMKDLQSFLQGALQNARAAVTETNRMSPEYAIDTKPLHRHKKNLEVLKKMSEDLKIKIDDISDYYKALVTRLNRARNCRERMAELTEMIQKTEYSYRQYAHILTEKRIAAGKAMSAKINAELPPLKLKNAQFMVQVDEKPGTPWTEKGFNSITFMARMNPGMPFSPMAETASGGELARMVLAMKVVLQNVMTIPMLVFDEVDTGIGGAAAAAVGERIAHLAETTQVMVITHSPQVASRGDQHLHVSKKTDGVVTTSLARMLTMDERVAEVSRMLAGETITTEAEAAARSLIREAATAATLRRQNLQNPEQKQAQV